MIEITALSHRNLAIGSLRIGTGRTFLIGPNGSGKTTLLRLLAGLDLPEAGTIRIDGADPRMVEIGWVNEYPDRSLLFSRVSDEIASSLRFRNLSCPGIDARVKEICAELGITPLIHRQVRELSGGEKVLAAVAAALVQDPGILILDEFDSHLDPARCRQIDSAIRSAGTPYVIRCTQQMETAASGDRVIAVQDGRIAHHGSPREVFGQLEHTPYYPRSWRKDA